MNYLDVDIGEEKYRLRGEAKDRFLNGLRNWLKQKEKERLKEEIRELKDKRRELRRRLRRVEIDDRQEKQRSGEAAESQNGTPTVTKHRFYETDNGWVGR